MNRMVKVHLALWVVAIIGGLNYTLAKMVMPEYFHPFAIIVLRGVICTPLYFILKYFTVARAEKVEKKDISTFVLLALFGVCANQLLFFAGLSIANPINAALLQTVTPILVLIIAILAGNEKFTLLKATGIILSFTGVILLLSLTNNKGFSGSSMGDLMVFGNAVFFALFLVKVKPLIYKYNTFTILSWVFLIGSFINIPFGIVPLLEVDWMSIPAYVYWIVAFIVLGMSFFNYMINIWMMKYVDASVIGSYIYLQPVIAALFAVALGKDMLTLEKFILSILIIGGVVLVSYKKRIKQTITESI